MERQKQISSYELGSLFFLLQQSSTFWLLPHFLVKENGTLGLISIVSGVIVAFLIIGFCGSLFRHIEKGGIIAAIYKRYRVVGSTIGGMLIVLYILLAVIELYGFVDVVQKQLLEETPRVIICISIVLLAAWLGWCGLEQMGRFSVLCMVVLVAMFVSSIVGSVDLFQIENALPLKMNNQEQLKNGVLHSIRCYSGFLSLLMVYPFCKNISHVSSKLIFTVLTGTTLLIGWIIYTVAILGQHSLKTILWLPVQLSRMAQIGTLVQQTESLFVAFWMGIALIAGSLLLWCALECMRQLYNGRNIVFLYSMIVIVTLVSMLSLENTVGLLQLEWIVAQSMPAVLLLFGGILAVLVLKRSETL